MKDSFLKFVFINWSDQKSCIWCNKPTQNLMYMSIFLCWEFSGESVTYATTFPFDDNLVFCILVFIQLPLLFECSYLKCYKNMFILLLYRHKNLSSPLLETLHSFTLAPLPTQNRQSSLIISVRTWGQYLYNNFWFNLSTNLVKLAEALRLSKPGWKQPAGECLQRN